MKIRFIIAWAALAAAAGFGLSSVAPADGGVVCAAGAAKCYIPTTREAFDRSSAVFLGEITDEKESGDDRVFGFDVEKYWKGKDAAHVEVSVYETSRFQALFKQGEKYLIYADADANGRLRISKCSRLFRAADAGEDLRKLGKGKVPR
ncbi:MAG: hypothetical protein JSS81_16070 [Acidobacteria bacterium]|nr:hypothetical protein [Acidobacteriota bacterium]